MDGVSADETCVRARASLVCHLVKTKNSSIVAAATRNTELQTRKRVATTWSLFNRQSVAERIGRTKSKRLVLQPT